MSWTHRSRRTGVVRRTLRVGAIETYEIPVPFVETFKKTGDAERFAREFTAFFRVFSESPLRLCLADLDDVDGLIDDAYARAERLIRDDPRRHDYHFIALARC